MSCEIELKLRLSPREARRFSSSPLLAGVVPEKNRLFNTYFDTPELDLRKRGIALRLRRKGWSVWLMTVKGGDSGAGGLAQRREWEAPTQPGVFDFSIVDDPALRAFLEKRQGLLVPLFTTDFTRTAWLLKTPNATLELALDRGTVKANRFEGGGSARCEALCEVEIELLEGRSTDALFDVAIQLAMDFQLHPEVVSKAERGYSLAGGVTTPPTKGINAKITPQATPVEAFRAAASACLLQLQRNEAGVLAGENPEYLHQARIAIRRLRSAFRVFRPVLSKEFVATYLPRWKALGKQLSGARDWDVFLADTVTALEAEFRGNPDLERLRKGADACRKTALKVAADALTAVDYSRLLLAFSAALLRETEPTIARANPEESSLKLRRFAAGRLQKREGKVVSFLGDYAQMNDEQRHRLRIEFKKLRYALEFFAPVLPSSRLLSYQATLSRVQEVAGQINDHASAIVLIRQLIPDAGSAQLFIDWLALRADGLVPSLKDEFKHFQRCRKAW